MRVGWVMGIQRVGICLKPQHPDLGEVVRSLAEHLESLGIEVLLGSEAGDATGSPGLPRNELAGRVDLIIVLGGDGTLLAVARAIDAEAVPILGVNLGTLGFLAEISQAELFNTIDAVLAGRFRTELRMRLEVRVEREGGELGRFLALNEAAISNTALSRMVELEMYADGAPVTTYNADGLIIATPTGSTAYSMSAGGPLLLPTAEAVVLTPICPHTLKQRPLVLPPSCEVAIWVRDTRGGQVQLSVDGQVGRELRQGDCVVARRAENSARFLVPPDRNRFEVMRAKLGWGAP